jgi:dUTP pyrophosphatase
VPGRAYAGDAGLDLAACDRVELPPGERALVGTGLAVAIPEGHGGFVLPRSGLAARHGISIVNAPGLIDAGYRGEVKVLLVNHDPTEPIELRRGDRVAQLVFQRVEQAAFSEVDVLPASARGDGGYGSTGGFSPRSSGPDAGREAESERT